MNNHLREHAERNLGAIAVTIEFTLISVMVGVILFPQMDFAAALLRDMKFEYWPYIIAGLIFILFLWTLVISHALTFVGWPIDLGHNLLYIVLSMVFAIQMHFLADPTGWWALTICSALVGGVVTWYDRKLIETRIAGADGATKVLYQKALQTQQTIFRRFPVFLGISVLSLVLILLFPTFFLEMHGHVILVLAQIIVVVVALRGALGSFHTSAPAILEKEIEILAREEHGV